MEVVQGVAVVVSEAGALETAEAISTSLEGAALSISTSLQGAATSAKLSAEQMVAAMSSASAKMASSEAEGANIGAAARIAAARKAWEFEYQIDKARIAAANAQVAAAASAQVAKASAAARLAGADSAVAGYLAEADAIVTSNVALGVQQVQLQAIATQLKEDVAAFVLLGEEGVVAADSTAEALQLVTAALASIRAEQAAVTSGMAGIAASSVVAGDAAAAASTKAAAGILGVNAGLLGMVSTMAPLAAVIGLAVLTKDAEGYAVSLERLHQRLGISTEDLSAFHVAAKLNNMDVEDMNRAFVMLSKNIDLALHDKKGPLTNFGELLHMTGAEVKAWGQGGDLKSHMLDVANALDRIPDAETRLAKASELLARAGGGGGGAAQLLNTLHSLAGDGFATATAAARELGVVVDEQTGQQALEFQRSWERVKLSLEGLGLAITKILLPALQSLNEMIADSDPAVSGWISPKVDDYIAQKASQAGRILKQPDFVHRMFAGQLGKNMDMGGAGGSWDPDSFGPQPRRPGTADDENGKQGASLRIAQDELAVAKALNAEAHASNALDKLAEAHGAKMLEIQQQLDKQKKGVPKDFDEAAKSALGSQYEAAADQKRSAEAENYNRARAAMIRADDAHLASLDAELSIQRMQVAAAGTYDSINQAQIQHEIRLASLRKDGAAALAALDPHADNYRKLRTDAQESTRNQVATENAAFQTAQERQQYADSQRLAAMKLQSAEAERGVGIAQRTADLTDLQRTKVMTIADVERKATLERANALDELATKAEQARALAANAIGDLTMGTDKADPASVARLAERTVEINTTTTATLVAQRIAYQSQISQIDANAEQGRAASRQAFNYSQQAQQLADYQKFADAISPIIGIPLGSIVAHFRKALDEEADRAKEIHNRAAQDISGSVSDIFGAATGARSWNDAFSSIANRFQSSMGEAINAVVKHWTDQLARTANGMPELAFGADGQPYPLFPSNSQQSTARNTLKGVQIAGAGIGIAQQSYAAGYSGTPGARTQGLLSAGVTGASLGFQLSGGNPAIAAVAAVAAIAVSAITSALGASARQADYKYGIPAFDHGTAELVGTRNLTPAAQAQMTAQLQATYTDTWNTFTKIMLKLPGSQMPDMPSYKQDPFQDNPSAHWSEHFSEYLSTTLPKEIAGMFKAGMESSFVRSGMTTAAFEAFWAEADSMDPTKRAQFWSDMADGLASFDRAAQNMKASSASFGSSSPARFDSLGNLMSEGQSQFVADTKVAATNLYAIARQMVNVTGPDKAAAFKALGAGVESLTKSLQDFLSRIGQVKIALKQTFDDARLEMGLSRLDEQTDANGNVISPQDKNAQAKLLQDRADQNLYQINNAAKLGLTPEQVQDLTNQTIGILQRLYSLDPSKEAYDWWLRQMRTLEAASTLALHDLGEQAKTAVDKILITLQPFEDWFLGLPVNLDPAWAALDSSIFGAADALADLQRAIRNAIPAPPGDGTTIPPGTQPGKGPGGSPGGDIPEPVIPPMNVTVYVQQAIGIDDWKRQMTQAAAEAFRNDPGMLERPYS